MQTKRVKMHVTEPFVIIAQLFRVLIAMVCLH
nr:MAG TPA_asm: hypothetical protein [Caudoviricetes sp.]